MPPHRPLFTIAIPTFNRAAWVRECVRAALDQTFGSFEVVVSDNASADETPQVLKAFSDERLVVLRQDHNIGAVPNWNACLAAARGTYIVFVCDDDSVAPHFLERSAAVLSSDAEVPIIVGLADALDEATGVRRPPITSQRLNTGVQEGTEILLDFLRGRISPAMCTVVMRTDVLRARGGLPQGWPHTFDLVSWVPMLFLGRSGLINEACGTRRDHEGTLTAGYPVSTRVKDIDKLAGVIIETAGQTVRDPQRRADIVQESRRYVARHLIGQLGMARRAGLSAKATVATAWEWRSRLWHASSTDASNLARTLTLLLLPVPVMRLLSQVKRRLRRTSVDPVDASRQPG